MRVKDGEVKALGVVLVKGAGLVANGFCSSAGFGAHHYLTSGAAALVSRLAKGEDE